MTIVFYDKRVHPTQPTLVDLFLAQSFDGGVTWQPNLRLTHVSSDLTLAPLTSDGYMLGDYIGIAESTTPAIPAVAAYIDTRTGSPDPFVVRAGIAPQLDFTSWRAARFSAAATADPQQGSPGADPDGDGVVNAMEYALGLQPLAPDRATFTPLPREWRAALAKQIPRLDNPRLRLHGLRVLFELRDPLRDQELFAGLCLGILLLLALSPLAFRRNRWAIPASPIPSPCSCS